MQEKIRVQLNFPLEQTKKPIIWHFAHDYGLRFSIRQARIDPHIGGYTVLDLEGEREKILSALAWAQQEGIEISTLGSDGNDEWVI